MTSDQDEIDESVSIDLGKQFSEIMGRLLSIEADTAVLFKYQAKILSELQSRNEDEILEEMAENRTSIHEGMSEDFFESIGFSEEFVSNVIDRDDET